MKLKDFIQLSREEQEQNIDSIYSTMTELGIDELVSRIKSLVNTAVSDSVWGRDELVNSGDYIVRFKGNKIVNIIIKYSEYDELRAELNCAGFTVTYEPEHGEPNNVLNIDGFAEFLQLTEGLKK